MSLQRLAAPAGEPLSLADAKAHLRVDTDTEDALILTLVSAARRVVEARTGLALMTQTWRWRIGEAPCAGLALPRRPVATIGEARVECADGSETVLDAGTYRFTAGEPPRIDFPGGVALRTGDRLRIDFTAGYGDAGAVPADLVQAVRILTAHFYERREIAEGERYFAVPDGLDALLAPYRAARL